MAQDTDPGVGVGDPIGSGFPSSSSPSLIPQLCVTFDRSLEILIMGNKAGAYGFQIPNAACDRFMAAYQREGWIDKMRAASSELKRDLGAPICAEPIYDELHPLKSRIKVRQAPVAYLGKKTFSTWLEINLADDGGGKSTEICDGDLGGATIDEVQVSYPDAVLECYTGLQTLQAPCVTRIIGSCGGGTDGYKLWWPLYQLVDPAVDETDATKTADFLTAIKWRVVSLDATQAVEIVGECDCACCNSASDLTVTLEDAVEGNVCIESCVTDSLCTCYDRQIRLNYATDFSYGSGVDPALEEALVLLALVRSEKTAAKPCGCDNSMIEHLLSLDPTAATEFATKLSYGPTVAGMTVMRIVNKFLKRPHFNQPVMSGGLFSGRSVKKKRRAPSYLRGF